MNRGLDKLSHMDFKIFRLLLFFFKLALLLLTWGGLDSVTGGKSLSRRWRLYDIFGIPILPSVTSYIYLFYPYRLLGACNSVLADPLSTHKLQLAKINR